MWNFKNDSSSTLAAFGVINLTGVEKQDNGEFWLTADQCDSAANFLLAVNGPQQVAAGEYGLCKPLSETLVVSYDTGDGTPANEENWGPDNGTFKLKKNFGGGQYAVIGADSSAEVALVMVTGVVKRWGRASAAIAGQASGTVKIMVGTGAPTSWTDSGDTKTAQNVTGVQADLDAYLDMYYAGSQWNFMPLECPA